MNEEPVYDLEERLLDFGATVITLTRKLTSDYAAQHVGHQLLRSGTSPLANHGEAQAAESATDFIHKMRIALKELRESERWLKLIQRANLLPNESTVADLMNETDQLIRIFVTSIATAEKRRK